MNAPQSVSILVVDRHPIVGDALVTALQSLVLVNRVVAVPSLAGAKKQAQLQHYDVLIIDHLATGKREFACLEAIKNHNRLLRIVHFASDESNANVDATFDSGIDGFVPKSMPVATLLRAVDAVLEGDVFVPPSVGLGHSGDPGFQFNCPEILSERRQQVLLRVLEGDSNAEIAGRLNIAVGTVKSHVSTIMRAFNVSSRARLILRARGLDRP